MHGHFSSVQTLVESAHTTQKTLIAHESQKSSQLKGTATMHRDIQDIKRDLKHVYWLGGSSCAGKSTIAQLFEDELGFDIYPIDPKWFGDHLHAADPKRHPGMVKYREAFDGLSIREIFETFSVENLIKLQINFFTEEFEMVIDDLYEFPKDKPILAEGTALFPSQVSPVTEPHQAIWLVATETHERKIRQQRMKQDSEWNFEMDPWFDDMITWSSKRKERTTSQAEQLGLKFIETDGIRSVQDTFDMIKSHFELESNNP